MYSIYTNIPPSLYIYLPPMYKYMIIWSMIIWYANIEDTSVETCWESVHQPSTHLCQSMWWAADLFPQQQTVGDMNLWCVGDVTTACEPCVFISVQCLDSGRIQTVMLSDWCWFVHIVHVVIMVMIYMIKTFWASITILFLLNII